MKHYCVVGGSEEGEDSIGQAAICIGKMNPNAMLSHVQFVPAPPAHGCAEFGESTIYVEVGFCSIKNANPHTIGILRHRLPVAPVRLSPIFLRRQESIH